MKDPQQLEVFFKRYMLNLNQFLPDGIIEVNLDLLKDLDLLQDQPINETNLTQSFYVVESSDKLTLFNDRFAVWIVPQLIEELPITYTLIALQAASAPQLEMAFSTSGPYNHSNLVLRILEKFLDQIEENEQSIKFKL